VEKNLLNKIIQQLFERAMNSSINFVKMSDS